MLAEKCTRFSPAFCIPSECILYPKDRTEGDSMQSGWRVGSIFGIPLFIDLSWFVILAYISVVRGLEWQGEYPKWGVPVTYTTSLLMALLLFGSVLLHELGHSLVAQSQGIKVNSITLFLFGGIAAIDQESKTPGKAFQVAIAGPLVSLALFVLLGAVSLVIPEATSPLSVLTHHLANLNLVLALFNLLPGLPLDGGQVLKAMVWKITGSRFQGIHWAARTGRALGWIAILLGVLTFQAGGLLIALIGWFVLQNANTYDRMTDLQEALLGIHAVDAMTRDFRVVDATMTLRQFADEYLLATTRPSVYFAASEGRYRGIVRVDDLHYIERSEWEHQSLMRIIQSLDDIPTVAETTSLVGVIQKMEANQLRQITVLSPAGAVAGIIDRGDIVRALAKTLDMPVSDAIIRQIKEEGSYPPGFQLDAIAQAVVDSLDSPPS
jgi:Zn-dependent protease